MKFSKKILLTPIALLISTGCFAQAGTLSDIVNLQGNRGQTLTLKSSHTFKITNTNAVAVKYNMYGKVCANNKGCLEKTWSVVLQPRQVYENTFTLGKSVNYANGGHYNTESYTSVKNDNMPSHVAYGYINIY